MNYNEFLNLKIDLSKESGFDIELNHDYLKPHERDIIKWAVKGGKRAIFTAFGTGKTLIQLEIMKAILDREGGKCLIVCPLGVKQEFKRDAKKFLNIDIEYVRNMSEIKSSNNNLLITNYERIRDGDIDPKYFTATSLDEASVLRGYGTKTYQEFLIKFKGVKYKFVCTATPSPNKFKEIIHYAGYLEIMDTGQALTRFFKRDSTKANNLTLYKHKEMEFWLWVSSWAIFMTKPSDMGYDNTGYDLPPLKVIYHKLQVDHRTAGMENDGQGKMFRDAALSLRDASKEKRDSLHIRIDKMMEIVKHNPDDHFIIWHDLEIERHLIGKALPESVEVYGTQDLDIREQRVIDFSDGKIKYIATKPRISGSGCNFQRYCHKAIFLGIGYKFHDFIQAIHRIYRFLQEYEVEIHIIYMESEEEILKTLLEKWKQHEYLVGRMIEIMKEYGLSITNMHNKLARTIGVEKLEYKSKYFHIVNNDCVMETNSMSDNSVDMVLTSIPFSNHYEYTPSYNDFGHNKNNEAFFKQMDFLTPELLRVLRPGRVACIHTKDRILFGNATGTGMPTVDPFTDLTVMHFIKHGFQYMGRIVVVTDVVRENNQTYRLGWTECTKDGTKMGVGCPEYVLLFRKLPSDTGRAYADIPVVKSKGEYTRSQWQIDAHGFWRSSGNRFLTNEELKNIPVTKLQDAYRKFSRDNLYNYNNHVDLAKHLNERGKLPASFMVCAPGSWVDNVWDNINRMLTLNTKQAAKNLQYHICPLQFDIIERCINRYTNKGDIIYDPFGGLMTVPYMAVKMERYGIGVELNTGYYVDGYGYLKALEESLELPTLFDIEQIEKVG